MGNVTMELLTAEKGERLGGASYSSSRSFFSRRRHENEDEDERETVRGANGWDVVSLVSSPD